MEKLLRRINSLRRGPVAKCVSARMGEFRAKGQAPDEELFRELCFCLLTANYTSEGGIRIQKAIGGGFLTMGEAALAAELRRLGYRFPNARARYIVAARQHRNVRDLLAGAPDERSLRKHVADSVLGLGFKEASHFLRNIGYTGLAIIDFHVMDVLAGHGMIERPKSRSLSRKKYLEVERVLDSLAERAGLTQGELDLYLWYLETGKILK